MRIIAERRETRSSSLAMHFSGSLDSAAGAPDKTLIFMIAVGTDDTGSIRSVLGLSADTPEVHERLGRTTGTRSPKCMSKPVSCSDADAPSNSIVVVCDPRLQNRKPMLEFTFRPFACDMVLVRYPTSVLNRGEHCVSSFEASTRKQARRQHRRLPCLLFLVLFSIRLVPVPTKSACKH
jgi:hypothetical protein